MLLTGGIGDGACDAGCYCLGAAAGGTWPRACRPTGPRPYKHLASCASCSLSPTAASSRCYATSGLRRRAQPPLPPQSPPWSSLRDGPSHDTWVSLWRERGNVAKQMRDASPRDVCVLPVANRLNNWPDRAKPSQGKERKGKLGRGKAQIQIGKSSPSARLIRPCACLASVSAGAAGGRLLNEHSVTFFFSAAAAAAAAERKSAGRRPLSLFLSPRAT